jgi:hypothetical protein
VRQEKTELWYGMLSRELRVPVACFENVSRGWLGSSKKNPPYGPARVEARIPNPAADYRSGPVAVLMLIGSPEPSTPWSIPF